MPSEKKINQLKADMIGVGKRLERTGLLVGKGGNFSVRLNEEELLITASGYCKSMLSPDLISRVNMNGELLEGRKPALDIRMHLEVYKMLPEVNSIAHSHPPISTGFAMSNYNFAELVMPEVILDVGGIEMTDFSVATTGQVPQVVHQVIERNPKARALILKGHGVLTFSTVNIMDACFKMEVLESACLSIVVARSLGGLYQLTPEEHEGVLAVLNGTHPDTL